MKNKLLIILLLLICTASVSVYGQTNTKNVTQPIVIPSNVNPSLTAKETFFLTEVFSDKLESHIMSNSSRLRAIKHLLRNRVEIKLINNVVGLKYKELNNVALFTAYNSNLERDTIYNEDTFNVLKYDLPFFGAKGKQIYRINNSNHFLIIKSLTYKK